MKSTREWWLVVFVLVLGLSWIIPNALPSLSETLYPVIDSTGSNMLSMETDKKVYSCGETVRAYFLFQKQRYVVGQIKWKLVPNRPNSLAHDYLPRVAASTPAIVSYWAKVETIPVGVCEPGEYHFEGMLTYPLFFGQANYPLRTTCFEVRAAK
jgi:hypothetical protein